MTLTIELCHQAFSGKLDELCDLISPEPAVPNMLQDVGMVFNQDWRPSESKEASDRKHELAELVSSHLATIRRDSRKRVKDPIGPLCVSVSAMQELIGSLKYAFLTGTEEDYDRLCADLKAGTVDPARLAVPTVPMFDFEVFGHVLVRIVALIVAREIVIEAMADSQDLEVDRLADAALFRSLREVLVSIVDAHRCVCEVSEESEDDEIHTCKCPRGGGLDVNQLSSLSAQYMAGDGEDEESPMHEITIADEILGVDMDNDDGGGSECCSD